MILKAVQIAVLTLFPAVAETHPWSFDPTLWSTASSALSTYVISPDQKGLKTGPRPSGSSTFTSAVPPKPKVSSTSTAKASKPNFIPRGALVIPGCKAFKTDASSVRHNKLAMDAFDSNRLTRWVSYGEVYGLGGAFNTSYTIGHQKRLKTTFASYPDYKKSKDVYGEWIEITFNEPVNVLGYSIRATASTHFTPASWKLLVYHSSLQKWYEIHSVDNEKRWNQATNGTIYNQVYKSDAKFAKFRLVVSKTNGIRFAAISELNFHVKDVPVQLSCHRLANNGAGAKTTTSTRTMSTSATPTSTPFFVLTEIKANFAFKGDSGLKFWTNCPRPWNAMYKFACRHPETGALTELREEFGPIGLATMQGPKVRVGKDRSNACTKMSPPHKLAIFRSRFNQPYIEVTKRVQNIDDPEPLLKGTFNGETAGFWDTDVDMDCAEITGLRSDYATDVWLKNAKKVASVAFYRLYDPEAMAEKGTDEEKKAIKYLMDLERTNKTRWPLLFQLQNRAWDVDNEEEDYKYRLPSLNEMMFRNTYGNMVFGGLNRSKNATIYGFSQEGKTAFDVKEPFYKEIYDKFDVIQNDVYGPESERLGITHACCFGGGGQKTIGNFSPDIKHHGDGKFIRELFHYRGILASNMHEIFHVVGFGHFPTVSCYDRPIYQADCGMPLRALSDKFRDPNADYKVCAANGIQVQTVFDGTACFFDGEAPALYCENQMVCEGQDCLDRCISFGGKSLVCYPTAKQAKKEFTKASELTSFCFPVVGPAVGCESIERPQVAALVPSEEKLRDERCVQDDYGSPFGIMGSSGYMLSNSVWDKVRMNWAPERVIQTITTAKTSKTEVKLRHQNQFLRDDDLKVATLGVFIQFDKEIAIKSETYNGLFIESYLLDQTTFPFSNPMSMQSNTIVTVALTNTDRLWAPFILTTQSKHTPDGGYCGDFCQKSLCSAAGQTCDQSSVSSYVFSGLESKKITISFEKVVYIQKGGYWDTLSTLKIAIQNT